MCAQPQLQTDAWAGNTFNRHAPARSQSKTPGGQPSSAAKHGCKHRGGLESERPVAAAPLEAAGEPPGEAAPAGGALLREGG